MKKLLTICLLLAIAFTSQAQDGKPTKEETVQFIKSHFDQNTFSYDCFTESNLFTWYKKVTYKNFILVFNGNILELSWEENYKLNTLSKKDLKELNEDGTYKKKITIDFSKVELIELTVSHDTHGCEENYIIYASFKTILGHKFKSESDGKLTEENLVEIPIKMYECDSECNHEAINKKILQAFNHLRKLCGAPEPISFD